MADRYQGLDVNRTPEILLMKGGVGRVENSDLVSDIWLARDVTTKADAESETDDSEAADSRDDDESTRDSDQVTPVVFRSLQDDGVQASPEENATKENETTAADASGPPDQNESAAGA